MTQREHTFASNIIQRPRWRVADVRSQAPAHSELEPDGRNEKARRNVGGNGRTSEGLGGGDATIASRAQRRQRDVRARSSIKALTISGRINPSVRP